MRSLTALLTTFVCCLPHHALAEISATTEQPSTPWTSLTPKDAPDDFYFAIVTDRTGGARTGIFPAAMDKLNLLEPAFVVSVGDFIEGYTENAIQLEKEWDEFEKFVSRLETPFFYTPGNHDMSNALMAQTWQQRFGPSFYHFTYKGVLFLSLNSELFGMVEDPDTAVPGPWRQQEQMDFVRDVLAEFTDVRWTVVLVHQPLWGPSPGRKINADWLTVEELLGKRNYTVFAGHYHQYAKTRRHSRSYITLATTGGSSQLRGPMWGEFDQVGLVKMTDRGPLIANLVLDGILDENVATHASRQILQQLQQAVVAAPVLGHDDIFSRDTFPIQVANPMPAPLSLSGRIITPGNFQISGLKPMTIGSHSSESIDLTLSVDTPVPYHLLQTASIGWTLTTQDANGNSVQVETLTPIRPLTTHSIGKVRHEINVDGNLAEWDELPFTAHYQVDVASPLTTPTDISFEFDIKTDEEAMYIAVAVHDDQVVADPGRLARLQDAIAVSVDTRAQPLRLQNMPVVPAIVDGFYGGAVVQILALNGATSDTFIPSLDTWAAKVTSALMASATGYTLELAIPHDVLDQLADQRWQHARIGIRAYDLDEDDATINVLHWQPYRYGNAPLPGSHAFVRAP